MDMTEDDDNNMTSEHKRPLAVITGGTKGIGKETAIRLATRFDLALIYSADAVSAEATIKILMQQAQGTFKSYQCDVSQSAEVAKLMEKCKEDFVSPASVLINGAGVALKSLFLMEDHQQHIRSFEVNYFGAVNMIKIFLPEMVRQKFGRIINLSSNNVSINNRGSGAYCASKMALEKFSEILGGEVAKSGVTVNNIRPGIIDTEMSHDYLKRLSADQFKNLTGPTEKCIDASEIGRTIEFLIDSSQINSSTITVDSGHALFRKV